MLIAIIVLGILLVLSWIVGWHLYQDVQNTQPFYPHERGTTEWILTKDQEPKRDGLYIAFVVESDYYPELKVREAWFNTRKQIWTTVDGGYGFEVSAWTKMPTHICSGVGGSRHLNSSNPCNICGEY